MLSRPDHEDRSTVLVWGAMGFLGQHVVERLLARGSQVSVLCRAQTLYPPAWWARDVRWFEIERPEAEREILLTAVKSASVIYDFAGSSGAVASNRDPQQSLEENCRVHLDFLEACTQAGHRPHIVFPSSWLVYDRAIEGRATTENHPLGPSSIYGVHKLAIEQYLQIYARRERITYTICRITNPYGFDPAPRANYKVLNSFVQKALANTPITIFGDGQQFRDFLYIADLIDALETCGFKPEARNEIFNIASGRSYRLIDAVGLIQELVGGPQVVFEPWPREYWAAEPGDSQADVSKARLRLGTNPRYGLRAGLEETLAHYRHSMKALSRAAGH
jgi:UDP-glucose 4-epimerase